MLPGYSALSEPRDGIPPAWTRILSICMDARGVAVADLLHLPSESILRRNLNAAPTVQLLIPNRKRDRKRTEYWKLEVDCAPRQLIFSHPHVQSDLWNVPDDFANMMSTLGPFQFGAFGGYILRPDVAHKLTQNLPIDLPGARNSFLAFFDHQTGDYDGWLTQDDFSYVTYEHEQKTFVDLAVNSFTCWSELRVRQQSDM